MSDLLAPAPCLVPGCGDPVPSAGGASPYCEGHSELVWRFGQWIDGNAATAVLSFDRDRNRLDRGTWRAV
jgi:hypothetical protein